MSYGGKPIPKVKFEKVFDVKNQRYRSIEEIKTFKDEKPYRQTLITNTSKIFPPSSHQSKFETILETQGVSELIYNRKRNLYQPQQGTL